MTLPIVKRYLIALGRYKWLGLGVFILTVGAGGVVAIQPNPKPSYGAEGYLIQQKPITIFANVTGQIQSQAPTITSDFLQSPEVVRIIAQQTKQDFKTVDKTLKVDIPNPNKEAEPFKIKVVYRAETESLARASVTTALKTMVEYSTKINQARLEVTIEEISKRLGPVEQELREAQDKLEAYDRVEGAVLSVARVGALPNAIATAQEQQRQLSLNLEGYDAQIRSISERLGLTPDQAYVAGALSNDPILASLRVQIYQNEAQLAILQQDLLEDHPKIIEIRRTLNGLENLFDARAKEVLGANKALDLVDLSQLRQDSSLDQTRQQLASTLVTLQTEKNKLEQQLEAVARTEQQLRTEYATIPNKQLERDRLVQQVTLKKGLHDKMQVSLADARTASAEVVGSIAVAPEPVRSYPMPQRNLTMPIILIISGVAGLLAGGILILLMSLVDGKLYTVEEVRAWFQEQEVPILGVLPWVWLLDSATEISLIFDPQSPYLEFYERLRTSLRRVGEGPVKVLLLSSAGDKEGKTFCAYNLAIASARAGKRTLLIEADLRQSSQAHLLNVIVDEQTAGEPLLYYGNQANCIYLVPDIENLYLLPSVGPKNTAGIWESSEIGRLFGEVRGRFDLVVVDAPALSAGNEALLLEPLTDGMAIVCRPLVSEAGMLSEYVEPLVESEDIRLLGAIINGADIPVMLYSSSSLPNQPAGEVARNQQFRSQQLPNKLSSGKQIPSSKL